MSVKNFVASSKHFPGFAFKVGELVKVPPQQAIEQAQRMRKNFGLDEALLNSRLHGRVDIEDLLDRILVKRKKHEFEIEQMNFDQVEESLGVLGVTLNPADPYDLLVFFSSKMASFIISPNLAQMHPEDKNLALALGIAFISLGQIDAFKGQGVLIHSLDEVFEKTEYLPALHFVVHLLLPAYQLDKYRDPQKDPEGLAARTRVSRHYQVPVELVDLAFQLHGRNMKQC